MNILVLGVGNILLKDEGAGVRAIEEFERLYDIPPGVEVLDGGTSGIGLLESFEGRDTIIIVDCVRWGKEPGTIISLRDSEVPALLKTKISPHQLGISDLLAYATLRDTMPKKLVLIGIEPEDISTGTGLSDTVREKIPGLLEAVIAELRASGAGAMPKRKV